MNKTDLHDRKIKLIIMNINPTKLFTYMCKNGHLEYAQHILEVFHPRINISARNEEAFRIACVYGNSKIAQWLYEIKPTMKYIDEFKNQGLYPVQRSRTVSS